jgi:hypothetical protein
MKICRMVARRDKLRQGNTQSDAFSALLSAYYHDGYTLGTGQVTLSLDHQIETFLFLPASEAFDPELQTTGSSGAQTR